MKKEIIDKMSVLITTAFGLVAALSWNDAIKTAIDVLIPERTVAYKFYTAIIITLFSVIVTYFISKFKSRE